MPRQGHRRPTKPILRPMRSFLDHGSGRVAIATRPQRLQRASLRMAPRAKLHSTCHHRIAACLHITVHDL